MLGLWTVSASAAWIGAWVVYPEQTVAFGIPAILFLVVGAVLTIRVSRNLIGPTLVMGASAWLVYDVGTVYATASIENGRLPLDYLAAWLGAWTGPLAFIMIPILLVLFPDGTFSGRRKWFLPVFAIDLAAILVGALMMWGLPIETLVDVQALGDAPDAQLSNLTWFGWSLSVPAALSLGLRYRRFGAIQRQQTKWFVASVVAAPVMAFVAIRLFDNDTYDLISGVLAICMLPIAIAVAVLRYRLYDLGKLFSRTVSYALVIGLVGLVFAIGVVVIPNEFMESRAPAWLVAVSTLAVAALFNPMRRRIFKSVDRRFNRSRYNAERVAERFAGTLRDQIDPDTLVADWETVVFETMQPAVSGVWVRSTS